MFSRFWPDYDEQDSPFYVPPKPKDFYKPMWTPLEEEKREKERARERAKQKAYEKDVEERQEALSNFIGQLLFPCKNNKSKKKNK